MNSWMFKFSVIQTIQQMIDEGSMIDQQDSNLSRLCADLLLGVFGELDSQADQVHIKLIHNKLF